MIGHLHKWVKELSGEQRSKMADLLLTLDALPESKKGVVKPHPMWTATWHEDGHTCSPPCEEECFAGPEFDEVIEKALAKAKKLHDLAYSA